MSRSSKSSKKHSSHGSGSRSKGSSSSTRYSDTPALPQVSFLFTVNELRIDAEQRDEYHHRIPPTHPNGYTDEIQSRVMYYNNGVVSSHPGYQWYRGSPPDLRRTEGQLWRINAQEDEDYRPVKYSTCAVFACNPHLPIMVCPDDPFVNNTESRWQLLQILHPRAFPGLSQVAHEDSNMPDGPGLTRYVAGSHPRWIPSLVPSSYRWPHLSTPPPSTGLGGELAIVLGLMALAAEPDHHDSNDNTNILFLGDGNHRGCWRGGGWYGNSPPRGHPPTSEFSPMGFLVTVFLDPENPQGSTRDMLEWFEWEQPIVHG
ncbi:hypothetical protein BGZ63DRAFT_404548 [Mariannaea sp. PMI_226]|nr:hypothetical protein BGZ63DRAFT_404548 [Mariannaea sp. PMI_226]